jgi:RNA polymerase subunit RPABC4/transcription elongation factor Spt4
MNWGNVELVITALSAFVGAFIVALWISLVIWTFRDMRARSRDAFAQLLAALMMFVLGPVGIVLYLLLRPRETLAEKYERSLEEEALLQDIEERQICPGCKQPIESDYMVCPICHTRLRQPCVQCGRPIHPRWGVCPYCASSQKPVPGVDKAGRVTLLDLEKAEQEAAAALPEPAFEPSMDVGLETQEEYLPEEDFEPIPDVQWEAAAAETDESESLVDLFSGAEGASDVESTETDESAETDTTTDESPRRPLSLFRRS